LTVAQQMHENNTRATLLGGFLFSFLKKRDIYAHHTRFFDNDPYRFKRKLMVSLVLPS
jgi:hypothetical protein